MKLNLLQNKGNRILIGLLLVFSFLLVQIDNVHSQIPQMPKLSLTGADNSWDESWYPDGRIWLPASVESSREFLLPVFITNQWHLYDASADIYQPDPIKSFQFTVLYDSSSIRAVGIQKFGPRDADMGYEPLAKNFNISWDDNKDWAYKLYLNPGTRYEDYTKGRGLRIVGTSTMPLPNTDLDAEEYKVLLYIRFRIVPKDGQPGGFGATAGFSPIIIKNDTIKYNDLNVRREAPFMKLRNYYQRVQDDYPDPGEFTGLAGVNNRITAPSTYSKPNEWILPGVIYLRISDQVPAFDYTLERGVGTIPAISEISPELWDLADPITIDSASFDPFIGRRIIQIRNNTPTSRILDVNVVSDQPWLEFRTVVIGTGSKNPIPAPTRSGYINWIDNGILGEDAVGTPLPNRLTTKDGDIYFELRCDPSKLDPTKGEMTGIYVGYITFTSSTALVSPIRLRVTFIHFRLPYEPDLYTTGTHTGIRLSIRNSRGAIGDESKLIFGTGHRATLGVDTLFGEYPYEYAMRSFEARWFPPDDAPDAIKQQVPFGFGDFSPDDDNNDGSPKRSNSRDIRPIDDGSPFFKSNESIIYKCRIQEDTAAHYPLVLEWDLGDFPDGAILFIRDTLNGGLFQSVNMREATALSQTRRSFVIQDPRVKSFVIEYTLPRVINYVDDFGNPIIKKGWNLLSLPVRPINTDYRNVYPNAINRPYYFSQNQYQDEIILRVGIGYFIKYDSQVDKQFSGTFIHEIKVPRDMARVYSGWNTVGCVSAPVNVQDLAFTNFNLELPTQRFTREYVVWGYVTNRGFQEISEMRPGLGYWIKCDANGYVSLTAPANQRIADAGFTPSEKAKVYEQSDKIIIRDNAQSKSQLYMTGRQDVDVSKFEMPPAPPIGVFDIRFESNRNLSNSNSSVISLNGVTYPVSIGINDADAKYSFYDAATNEFLGTIDQGSNGSIVINSERSNAVRVMKETMGVAGFSFTSYPNPVENFSTIEYTLTENENVSIKLYDAIGNEVSSIMNGYRNAGSYSETLDVTMLAGGRYILKIVAGNNTAVTPVTVIK